MIDEIFEDLNKHFDIKIHTFLSFVSHINMLWLWSIQIDADSERYVEIHEKSHEKNVSYLRGFYIHKNKII